LVFEENVGSFQPTLKSVWPLCCCLQKNFAQFSKNHHQQTYAKSTLGSDFFLVLVRNFTEMQK
jgi:hypothetical protein